ncbi:MAG: hypothetical protein U0401_23830 [Anaerolineae bacterium]
MLISTQFKTLRIALISPRGSLYRLPGIWKKSLHFIPHVDHHGASVTGNQG